MLESIGRFEWQAVPVLRLAVSDRTQPGVDLFRATRRVQPEDEVPEPPGSEEASAEFHALHSIGRASMLELSADLSPEQRQVLTLKFVFQFRERRVAGRSSARAKAR